MASTRQFLLPPITAPNTASVSTFTTTLKVTAGGVYTLTGLMALFGIIEPDYPCPDGAKSINFFDLEIVFVSAVVSLKTDSSDLLQLEYLKLQAQTVGNLIIL